MQPHAELIKGESQAYPIEDRHKLEPFPGKRGREEKGRSHEGKKEDAVVQVMDVGSTQMQVEVGNVTGHYQKDENAHARERGQETGQNDPSDALGIQVGSSWAYA